jgi:hypothetical protein
VLALLALSLTACGDEAQDSSPPGRNEPERRVEKSGALSKNEYLRRTDRVCAAAQNETKPFDRRFEEVLSQNRSGTVSDAEISERIPPG